MLSHFLRPAVSKSNPIQFINYTSATATATSITLNKPTDTQQDDLMILVFQTQSSLSITLPSGWTTIVNAHNTTSDLRTTILYKVAGSSEPSSYSVGISSSRGIQGGIMTYRNASYSRFSGVAVSGSASSLNLTMLPSSTDNVIIHYSGRQSSTDLTSTPISGFTELFENFTSGTSSNSNLQISHVVPVNSTDTTGVSNTWSSSGGMSAAFIELVPTGFVPPPTEAVTASYVASYSSTTDATSYTFNSCDIGTAASNRYVVVVVQGTSTATRSVSNATIGGVTADLTYNPSAIYPTSFIGAVIETGTTADIVINMTGSMSNLSISVYVIYGLQSGTPVESLSATVTAGTSVSITTLDVQDGGVVIGCASSNGTGTYTLSGVTEQYDSTVETQRANGYSLITSDSTAYTVSATSSVSQNTRLSAVSWR